MPSVYNNDMRVFVLMLLVVSVSLGRSARAAVDLSATADITQPVGQPAVIELKMTNTGKGPVEYWTDGSPVPPASAFLVEGQRDDERWQPLSASNESHDNGIWGGTYALKPGESISVRLAIDVKGLPNGANV